MEGFNYNSKTDIMTFICCECGLKLEHDCSDFEATTEINIFGEEVIKNLLVHCDNCDTDHWFNMNLPEGENDEIELEDAGKLPLAEVNTRKYLRDIMWKKRVDLKELDRNELNEDLTRLSQNAQKILKRNNLMLTILSSAGISRMLSELETEVIKYEVMRVVNGEVSLLEAIKQLPNFLGTE